MRVLIVHNRYRSHLPSGENQVVEDEIDMLAGAGLEVTTYLRESDEIDGFDLRQKAGLAVSPVISRASVRDISNLIDRSRPDIFHLHNPYPLISPQVIRTATRHGIPVVQTVHNYRHICMTGTFFRDGQVCEDCDNKRAPWPGMVHGCYRGSRAQSTVMTVALTVHRSTWQLVDRFLPVSAYVGKRLASLGIPDDRITVKPNPVADPGPPSAPGKDVLFAGRLDEEKGVRLLLDAWQRSGIEDRSLVIAGDGPLAELVESAAASCASISWLGLVPSEAVGRLMESCGVVVVPSTWFEGFPRTIAEAYARGRPVITSDHGALRAVVTRDTGWTVAMDPGAWASALTTAVSSDLTSRASAAREYYERHLQPGHVLAQQLAVYSDLTDARRRSSDAR